jgi:hypothetical protein
MRNNPAFLAERRHQIIFSFRITFEKRYRTLFYPSMKDGQDARPHHKASVFSETSSILDIAFGSRPKQAAMRISFPS